MAKLTGQIKLKGTIGDLTFIEDASKEIYVREKGKSGITKKKFKENPIFGRIWEHGTEFGSCSHKSRIFRLLAKQFYDKAKEVSFAGRVNQILFEILEEDTSQPIGARKLENGLQIPELDQILVNFEGNRLRPLHKILKRKITFDWTQNNINLTTLNLEKEIVWPEPVANQIHLQLAIANWNYREDKFENQYSNEIIIEKTNKKTDIIFKIDKLQTKDLWIAYLFIGFSNKERRKTKLLHKKWNTATIIGIKKF